MHCDVETSTKRFAFGKKFVSLEPFNKTFKMSSPSDSSSCTSESDLESFTVDEVMGAELSEFAPYDDSCEPLATEEELQRKSSSRRRRGTTVSAKIFGRGARE